MKKRITNYKLRIIKIFGSLKRKIRKSFKVSVRKEYWKRMALLYSKSDDFMI